MLAIFLILIFSFHCSDDGINSIKFNQTEHPISKINKEMVFSIIVSHEQYYRFLADSMQLNCEGEGCNVYLVKNEEMNDLKIKLSDTNYFHWEFLTAVTPYPESDCNLFIYGIDEEGNHLYYMCTIGRGDDTFNILIELSKSFSSVARAAFVEIANYYKE